jgi:hypothetical protein
MYHTEKRNPMEMNHSKGFLWVSTIWRDSPLSGFAALLVRTACQSFLLFPMLVALNAGTNDPFALGYSMGNNGTIIQATGPAGRQPWIPACFTRDTFRFGVSVCGIDYYDPMDNLESSHIVQVAGGAWYARNRFIVKASYAHLNALGLYCEQQGFVSIGFLALRALSGGIEISANRIGLSPLGSENQKFLNAGASLFIFGKTAALSLSCSHLPLAHFSSYVVAQPITGTIGLHTTINPFGAQGVLGEIFKERDYVFRFSIGESYNLSDYCAVCGAFSTNPFMMHIGISFSNARGGIALAFVNHPILGWSKGLTIDYAHP